jgi:hypothetical protein
MLPPDKSELLRAFLGSLPRDMASRLASAVELDRLVDGKALPHDLILEGLRPVLRTDDMHKRTPTPLRLFCRPFEDLLVNVAVKEKQKGRILRSHVVPVWTWVSLQVIPEESKAYASDVRNLVVMRKYDEALARAEKFWPIAGEALTKSLAADVKKANTALGGPAVAADAEDMAAVLKIGGFTVAIQNLLPKPTPTLSEELLWGLRNIYDAVAANHADAAPFISVIAMRRLAKPWEALKLALAVARQTQDTLISSTDMGLAGDVLFSDMEDSRMAIMQIRHPQFDPDVLISQLTTFTNISSAIVKEVEILRQGRWGQRLLKDRSAVGNVMDGFMERAPKEISAALSTHKAGYSGGPRVPDLSRLPDPEKVERALRYAQVLARTKILAVPGSFGAKHTGAMEEAQQFVRSYSEDILKELRTAEGDRRNVVERQFQLCLELTALLYDENEVEFLRRRGKAAGAQSIAA